jgi:hypothetical protein
MPYHNHAVPTLTSLTPGRTGLEGIYIKNDGAYGGEVTGYAGGFSSHDHLFSGGGSFNSSPHDHTFTGSSHNHSFSGTSIDLNVKYVDTIIATKD